MDLEKILRESGFVVNQRGGWSAFSHSGLNAAGFRSSRVGKFYSSGSLVFTFGETGRGKAANLSKKIREAIASEGLSVVAEPSTSGQRRKSSTYVGFETSRATEVQVRAILEKVRALFEQ